MGLIYLHTWSNETSPETKQKVYDCFCQHGPISVGEATEILGMDKKTVLGVFYKLKSNGLITLSKNDRSPQKSRRWVAVD